MLKFIIALSFFAVAYAQQAVVYLSDPTGVSKVTGNLNLTSTGSCVQVTGEVRGLSEGLHGFHVHQFGNIYPNCLATGGHFNPYNQTHGAPEDMVRHVGDLGNIKADSTGVATVDIKDHVISLGGPNCIIGRSFVVHALADDLGKGGNADSLKTGNAGARVACGVIGTLQ